MSTAAEFYPEQPHPRLVDADEIDCSLDTLTQDNPNPLPREWRYTHGIADVTPIQGVEDVYDDGFKIGEITTTRIQMDEGSVYEVRDGRPTKQLIDQANVKTTAFMTRHDRGMNRHHQQRDMKIGYRSIIISRELEWDYELEMSRTAYNMAVAVKPILEADGITDPKNIELTGLSRAEMLAFGVKAMTEHMPQLGIHVFYMNGAGPCFADAMKVGLEYCRFPVTEAPSLLYHALKLPVRLLAKYPGTIDPDTRAMRANAKSLTSGDAGRFVEYIPTSRLLTNGYVLVMPDDIIGMGPAWQQKFSEHEGMRVEMAKPGRLPLTSGHLRIFNYGDQLSHEGRQVLLRDEVNNTGSLHDLDFDRINGAEPNKPRRLKLLV